MSTKEIPKVSIFDKKIGKIKRVIPSSGMLELADGSVMPPFPDVVVGDNIEVKDGRYYVAKKGAVGSGKNNASVDSNKDNAELKRENEELKRQLQDQNERLKNIEENFGERLSAMNANTGDANA